MTSTWRVPSARGGGSAGGSLSPRGSTTGMAAPSGSSLEANSGDAEASFLVLFRRMIILFCGASGAPPSGKGAAPSGCWPGICPKGIPACCGIIDICGICCMAGFGIIIIGPCGRGIGICCIGIWNGIMPKGDIPFMPMPNMLPMPIPFIPKGPMPPIPPPNAFPPPPPLPALPPPPPFLPPLRIHGGSGCPMPSPPPPFFPPFAFPPPMAPYGSLGGYADF
mmetsp:Transcript_64665/g.154361  ORF Transcript_64665/g.154361 Transcript_64665/m.154361 type:complete len:222 (-) Transcript_64665:7-672(-)